MTTPKDAWLPGDWELCPSSLCGRYEKDTLLQFMRELNAGADFDVAQYALGRTLGMFPPNVGFQALKWIFWTENPIGRFLHDQLCVLAHLGLVKRDEEEQWSACPPPMDEQAWLSAMRRGVRARMPKCSACGAELEFDETDYEMDDPPWSCPNRYFSEKSHATYGPVWAP